MGGDVEAAVILHKRAKVPGSKEWDEADLERMRLRAFVDHAVLAATGVAAGRARRCVTVVASREGPPHSDVATLAPISADEATVWLRGLVKDLLGAPHAYFLPCEAVFVHRRGGSERPIVPVIEEARSMMKDSDGPPALRSAYGPVLRVRDFPVPDETAARAIVEGRFSAFFEKVARVRS